MTNPKYLQLVSKLFLTEPFPADSDNWRLSQLENWVITHRILACETVGVWELLNTMMLAAAYLKNQDS